VNRRDFLRTASAGVVGAALAPELLAARARATALGRAEIRVVLIGCGGRGTGAAANALSTTGPVRLVAMADAFRDRLESSLAHLQAEFGERVDVPVERRFHGFDAFRAAVDCDAELVILATPPGFRPQHFSYAVEKHRHVFMEKPVAVDATGVREVLTAAATADARGLKVGVGLQRHHQAHYLETVRRIRAGAIGELVLLRAYWNSAGVWVNPRQPGQTEMEYQMRNWYYFNWLCGDHIVEQHVHNLDVANWLMGGPPARAEGMGGRQVRIGKDFGEIYDHHAVEYTYPNGAKLLSQCRHVPNCAENVSEHAHGTQGTADVSGGRIEAAGGWSWKYDGPHWDPYQREHDALFAAVREGGAHNEAANGAIATMTAILGRMATYSGKSIGWDEALASPQALRPTAYAWDAAPPSLPDAAGFYPIATPGITGAW
jgi:myo-inositol 2-dehydrogenase/D-chiro-inositol 1-dehydrogenase